MTQEALKLAIKDILKGIDQTEIESSDGWWETSTGAKFGAEALKQILELLAQTQEPVAFDCCGNCLRPKHEHQGDNCPKPYTTTWNAWDYPFAPDTTQLQRTWVGLTDEEIEAARIRVFIECGADLIPVVAAYFARAIEAKLKEKNT